MVRRREKSGQARRSAVLLLRGLFQEPLPLEPRRAEARPRLERGLGRDVPGPARTQAETVNALLEQVELDRHLVLPQGQGEQQAVLGGDPRVGVGVGEEGRRACPSSPGSRSRGSGRGPCPHPCAQKVVARAGVAVLGGDRDDGIHEDHPVGPRADAFDRVGVVGLAGVVVRAGGRGEVPAGREAQDGDLVRVEAPLRGAGADGSDRAIGVLERGPGDDSGGRSGT